MSRINQYNSLTNIGELREGQKVVLNINGTAVMDCKVHIGAGNRGKPRVWFCNRLVAGEQNSNPFGYRYAFSVGVESDGSLRLAENGVSGLREFTAADEAPVFLQVGTRITSAAQCVTGQYASATCGGVKASGVLHVSNGGVWLCQNAVSRTTGPDLHGYRFGWKLFCGDSRDIVAASAPILSLSNGRRISEDKFLAERAAGMNNASVDSVTLDGVTYSDGRASAGLNYATVAKFNKAIAEHQATIAKYDANKATYLKLAATYGWTTRV